jgi:hypothetical protein
MLVSQLMLMIVISNNCQGPDSSDGLVSLLRLLINVVAIYGGVTDESY